MKTLAKSHVCNHCVTGDKIFQNIVIGLGKLPGLSRNGPLILDPQMKRTMTCLTVLKRDVSKLSGPTTTFNDTLTLGAVRPN